MTKKQSTSVTGILLPDFNQLQNFEETVKSSALMSSFFDLTISSLVKDLRKWSRRWWWWWLKSSATAKDMAALVHELERQMRPSSRHQSIENEMSLSKDVEIG
ncbi:hypothetical protein RUM44_002694 [Polyplax serrata]|uniref:Uncharacterized protein n=1 Tax=Polyplax serrata TaxID=468196 RepID=A0ABR1AGT8_POLSC